MEKKEIIEMIEFLFENKEERMNYPKEHNSKLNIILNELEGQLRLI